MQWFSSLHGNETRGMNVSHCLQTRHHQDSQEHTLYTMGAFIDHSRAKSKGVIRLTALTISWKGSQCLYGNLDDAASATIWLDLIRDDAMTGCKYPIHIHPSFFITRSTSFGVSRQR
ncbi:hypothetical protein CDL15_Pgr010422 [Punica granatum]|uniref:Uncharacterized protein n=1 Tax=Punica granatum TaxID=22663 RepID=A0A218W387_PUNGR|nr:hypothetical protein CDL15_Pgr010422 [Punica granatum]